MASKYEELRDQLKGMFDDDDMLQEYLDECQDLDDEELQLEIDSNGESFQLYKQFAEQEYK